MSSVCLALITGYGSSGETGPVPSGPTPPAAADFSLPEQVPDDLPVPPGARLTDVQRRSATPRNSRDRVPQ